ncbi:MAG: phosphoribosylamine--glycine ligase [Bdellovibrionota bacterium]|nr:phosphoribosylamine--glycine ligase [Bdellovibrionota bacterium]
MKILVIGSGGREDAFLWKFQKEENVEKIYISPGHSAMERFSKVSLLGKKDHAELLSFALENKIDLTVVGPEAPLTQGLSDLFSANDLKLFGPHEAAAKLEGSKIFSKNFMKRHGIPTAKYETYKSYDEALVGLRNWPVEEQGVVIKADGLAGGKGVVVTNDRSQSEQTLHDFMVNDKVSVKSDEILFEAVLPGEEVSAFALCHGEEFFFLGCACDHKRVFDNDEGPNTGGMGCFHSPSWPDQKLVEKIKEQVLKKTLKGLQSEGIPFSGFLFMGLMIDEKSDPYVVEYNVRMGDPETQTLFPLLKGNLSKSLLALLNNEPLKAKDLSLEELCSVHVVMTSGGYPSIDDTPLELGHTIKGTDSVEGHLFLAGVGHNETRELINRGGRVLGVTALAATLEEARELAYQDIAKIDFKAKHYRRDIGLKERGQGR